MAGILLLSPVESCSGSNLSSSPPQPPSSGAPEPDVHALIDRLVNVSEFWPSEFPLGKKGLLSNNPITGVKNQGGTSLLQDLVKRGVNALPALIDHLSDSRATRLVLDVGLGRWYGSTYSPRFRDPERMPQGVNVYGGATDRRFRSYTLKVGDLCYEAIGQIVNRDLTVVTSRPTMCVEVTSPLVTPALAHAVREEWAGLTAEGHRASLSQDAESGWSEVTMGGLQRLCYYYPDVGEEMAIKLLSRPLYDSSAVWKFISLRLVKAKDSAEVRPLIDAFRKGYGEAAAAAIPFWLHWIYWETSYERSEEFLESRALAAKVLRQHFLAYDAYSPPFVNAGDLESQTQVLQALVSVRSVRINMAIMALFRSAVRCTWSSESATISCDDFVTACMDRLCHQDYDDEFKAYCTKRIRQIEATPITSSERFRLETLRSWLDKL